MPQELMPLQPGLRKGVNPDISKSLGYLDFQFLKGPANDLHHRVVIQKGAQVGATVLAVMRTAWLLFERQLHTLYLFPTQKAANRFLNFRFKVLLKLAKLDRKLERGETPGHMIAEGTNFYCHGSRSRAELISLPVSALILDERDELYRTSDSSDNPWNSVDMARQRLAGQATYYETSLSTPTIESHGISLDFARSKRHYYNVKCPSCPFFDRLTFPEAMQGLEPNEIATYRCPRCKRPWNSELRMTAIRGGFWSPENTQCDEDQHGYHMSQLYSCVVDAARLKKQWLEALKKPAAKQIFYNSVLGLPYTLEGSRLEEHYLEDALAAGSDMAMSHSSSGAVVGIDVGPQWHHLVAAEATSTGLKVIWAGSVLDWQEIVRKLTAWNCRCFVIDGQPETHAARELVENFPQGRLCYYRSGKTTFQDQDQARRILRVSRTGSLDAMYHRLRTGGIALPRGLPSDFADQLKAPARIYRQDGQGELRAIYVEGNQADHYAHALNYCCLAYEQIEEAPKIVEAKEESFLW